MAKILATQSQDLTGAYISENSTHHHLPDWAYLGRKTGENTMKEWPEHKINAILELSTLFNLINEFFYIYFGVICLISPNWGDNLQLVAGRGW